MSGKYPEQAKASSRAADDWVPWLGAHSDEKSDHGPAAKLVVLERTGWSKFLTGTPMAISAQFDHR